MSQALLITKLHIPPARPDLVARPRLIERLDAGMRSKLTLLSAPAGFGKTTLLSAWIHDLKDESGRTKLHPSSLTPHPSSFIPHPFDVAWVSLDEQDNDPGRFLSYFIAALQTVRADLGNGALALLHSTQPPPVESILTTLINEIASVADDPSPGSPLRSARDAAEPDFALVLDDYHLIENETIHQDVGFLIDHLPPSMRLVVSSRAEPPLPLARLRARRELTELGAGDLRFTPDETAAFLNQFMGLELSSHDIATLEARTEGWVTGLQLAALSMQGLDAQRIPDFIKTFAGDDRYVLDYLVDEVFRQQPHGVRAFLLRTSILSRLTGALCDMLIANGETGETAPHASQSLLEQLAHKNLFTSPIDGRRQWYRYHRLFAEFLRHRLSQTQPDCVPRLHRRASSWYEQQGLMEDAVRHALAAQDYGLATRLIEQVADRLWADSQIVTMLSWMKAMPDDLVRSEPRLSLLYAWALVLSGWIDAAEPYLQSAEARLQGTLLMSDFESLVPDAEQAEPANEPERDHLARRPVVHVTILRGFIARFRGDTSSAIGLSQQALERLPAGRHLLRGVALLNLGHAYLLQGNGGAANEALIEAAVVGRAVAHHAAYLSALHYLAQLHVLQGRLHQAAASYRQAQQSLAEYNEQSFSGVERIGMGDLLREWNDLEAASREIHEGLQLAESGGDFTFVRDGYIAGARVEQARGNWDAALAVIHKAERVVGRSESNHDIALVAAWRARLCMAQGNLAAARRWAHDSRLNADGELRFLQEFEYLTLARVFLAQGQLSEAGRLLERLLQSAEAAGRMGRVIEIRALQALALQARDDTAQALTALRQALALAEPEGYVRTFVDEGAPMRRLLQAALARSILPDYTARLLAAFGVSPKAAETRPNRRPSGTVGLWSKADNRVRRAEALNEREVEVLRLVAAGLSNLDIARAMAFAESTVKWHTHNIYRKLNVRSRTQALARARELGLLDP